jgi:hypothetical protein
MHRARRFGFFCSGPACMTRGTQPPRRRGRTLECVGEDSARDGWAQVGRVAFKRRVTPLKGDHVFALPYASCLSTFRAPGWGTPAILPPCRWRNATSWKLVPFSHRSASRIFITRPDCIPSPVVTPDGDRQPLDGEKQAGLRSRSRPQLQGCSSSLLGRATVSHPSAFCCSEGPPIVWGCSYLRRRNRSSVCNGTLSACVLFIAAVGA